MHNPGLKCLEGVAVIPDSIGMRRSYYSAKVRDFLIATENHIFGALTKAHEIDSGNKLQDQAWEDQIQIFRDELKSSLDGYIFFEFQIPRMGKRADNILVIGGCIFVIEFKIGANKFQKKDINQAIDYAVDLENFHSTSHSANLIPVLICTEAKSEPFDLGNILKKKNAVCLGGPGFVATLKKISQQVGGEVVDPVKWEAGGYKPTPGIIEASVGLFNNHNVKEISQTGAEKSGLAFTTSCLNDLATQAKEKREKIICFVTGVPGAGKTLVGLGLVSSVMSGKEGLDSVFLTGNRPLIAVLREALARDKVENITGIKIDDARRESNKLIQNIHEYRREYLEDNSTPSEHVIVFDEAQRAWSEDQVRKKAKGKLEKKLAVAEAETLISTMDNQKDWSMIVALVGGGQEINSGELGIEGWLGVLQDKYPNWKIFCSDELIGSQHYISDEKIGAWAAKNSISKQGLHLKVPMRSFKAENVANFVEKLLDVSPAEASNLHNKFTDNYPICLSRDFEKAKEWIKQQKRGTERCGVIASSHAKRLRPFGLVVEANKNPKEWFLNGDDDIRSSSFLEEVATEYQIQGLEIDWALVGWDANLRMRNGAWEYYSFSGTKWQKIKNPLKRKYLVNSYRVLLTRARQGMVIFLPFGDPSDSTRLPEFYDGTFEYLKSLGIPILK